jgi:hypothetical protein
MIYFFEYAWQLVDAGYVPSELCQSMDESPRSEMFSFLAMANRVYKVNGLEAIEIKNRSRNPTIFYLTNEDLLALKLRAVPIDFTKPRQ